MSAVWTKEMAEAFLETKPDPLFPCQTEAQLIRKCEFALSIPWKQGPSTWCGNADGLSGSVWTGDDKTWHASMHLSHSTYWSDFWEKDRCGRGGHLTTIANERDEFGRCNAKTENRACANCNCRMLFNQLECVKADLETTKKTLQETKSELHSTKETLQVTANELDETMEELHSVKWELVERNAERNEEKRKFASAIAEMVQSEMSDVRTQLSALNMCLKEELGEKSLAKKAASEAAKAALSASKDITLRLLMF